MSFNINFGRSFNAFLQSLIKDRLGDGYTFKKAYGAFEDGELRVIVSDAEDIQHCYALVDGELVERF